MATAKVETVWARDEHVYEKMKTWTMRGIWKVVGIRRWALVRIVDGDSGNVYYELRDSYQELVP